MTGYPHRIRLRGPWEYSIPGEENALAGRIHLPCNLNETKLQGHAGPVRFTRAFGYPGRIDADERVWLVIAELAREAKIVLNDRDCGIHPAGIVEFDASELLSHRNRLEIEMALVAGQKFLWEDAALEIRALAYLTQMRVARRDHALAIAGKIGGATTEPLELYAIVDGRNVAYQPVAAEAEISIRVEEVPPEAKKLRVELVSVSTIWYAWEAELDQSKLAHGPS